MSCEQCASLLEYEWKDIREYQNASVVFCPVCGYAIKVPEKMQPNYFATGTTVVSGPSLTIKGNDYWTPYESFSRDALCASNSTDGISITSALDSLFENATKAATIECDAKAALSSAQTQI